MPVSVPGRLTAALCISKIPREDETSRLAMQLRIDARREEFVRSRSDMRWTKQLILLHYPGTPVEWLADVHDEIDDVYDEENDEEEEEEEEEKSRVRRGRIVQRNNNRD